MLDYSKKHAIVWRGVKIDSVEKFNEIWTNLKATDFYEFQKTITAKYHIDFLDIYQVACDYHIISKDDLDMMQNISIGISSINMSANMYSFLMSWLAKKEFECGLEFSLTPYIECAVNSGLVRFLNNQDDYQDFTCEEFRAMFMLRVREYPVDTSDWTEEMVHEYYKTCDTIHMKTDLSFADLARVMMFNLVLDKEAFKKSIEREIEVMSEEVANLVERLNTCHSQCSARRNFLKTY